MKFSEDASEYQNCESHKFYKLFLNKSSLNFAVCDPFKIFDAASTKLCIKSFLKIAT